MDYNSRMLCRVPLLALLFSAVALAQTTGPATKPVWHSLAEGEIRYTAPAGWNAVTLTNPDGLSAAYKNADGNAVITLHVTPQQQPIPHTPAVAQSLGKQVLKAIRTDLENSKAEILEEPRLRRDPRFLIRIHDRIRLNGVTSDRLHLYRAMGYNLVQTTVDVDNQTPEQAKTAFAAGEQLLDGAVIGKREIKPKAGH
jgi:hypothetical protein